MSGGDWTASLAPASGAAAKERIDLGEAATGTAPTTTPGGPGARTAVVPSLHAGDCLGRYTVRAPLGAGGMGEVFAAHDPELDRVVALKVLRPDVAGRSPEARARFQREAQAMARLNHPNVVSVHDVGAVGDNVFVAMELVEGPTLAAWLAEKPRSWREVVDVFLQAGRGLEAAHAAGMVHRDFKPSNVIVGDRVRVADFGLARAAFDPDPTSSSGSSSRLDADVTTTGQAVGTPAYMAPEQRAGKPVGPLSDQYSFAVALHEALTGARRGQPAPAGPPRVVPGWVRAVADRGLRDAPAARYPSMRALLADLGRDPARTRRRALAAVGAVALAGVAVWGGRRAERAAADPCAVAVDRFTGGWDDAAARAVHDAFTATGASYAEASYREVARQLDARRAAWEAMRRESCEATRMRGVQSDAMMDARAVCLDDRAADLAAFVGELRKADLVTLRRAPLQAGSIGDVSSCADAAALARRAPLPTDPARRQAITAIEAELAVARARAAAGQHPLLLEVSDQLVARARTADYAPLLAEALALAADVQKQTDHSDRAKALGEEAVLAAEAGGDDRLRLEQELQLVFLVGYMLENEEEGQQHAQRAAALLTRLGGDPRMAARLAGSTATMEWAHGHYPEALRHAEEAIAGFTALDPDAIDLANALHMRGIIEDEMGNDAACLATEERARAIAERAVGRDHPLVGSIWDTTGGALRRLGRYDEARQAFRRSLEINDASHGGASRWVAGTLGNLATVDLDEKKYDDAIPLIRRAIAMYQAVEGRDGEDVALMRERLGSTLSKAGRPEEAEVELAAAVAIHLQGPGADSPAAAATQKVLGDHYMRNARFPQAKAAYAEAVRALGVAVGEQSSMLVQPLRGLGDAELALRRPAAAVAAYERALALVSDDSNQPEKVRAGIAASLAKARAEKASGARQP